MRCNLVRYHRARRTAAAGRTQFRLVSFPALRQRSPASISTIVSPTGAYCSPRTYSTRTCLLHPDLPLVDSASASSSDLPTIRAIPILPLSQPAEHLIARFQQLEQSIQQWSAHQYATDHWADCVRALVEMKQIHHRLLNAHALSEETSTLPPLTLLHFHQVFHAILLTCAAASPHGTSTYFPPNMLCKDWDGSMLSFCLGTEAAAAADAQISDASNQTAASNSHSMPSPSILRQSFRPDFTFYTRLMNRIERGPKARDYSLNLPSEHSAAVASNEGLWMLAMSLQQCRASNASLYEDDETLELGEEDDIQQPLHEPVEAKNNTPLPSLALVRHLFNGLIELDLRPTRQTINYMLAIFEQHIRTKHQLQGTQFELEQFDLDAALEQNSTAGDPSTLASSTPPSVDVSGDMLYLWKLWNDMGRLYHVHPDLLSQVLMLRLCYQHQQFAYMSRLLVDINATSRIVASTESVLTTHQFDEPHLLIDALTHSSKVSSRIESNERLEFLGDSVLDVLVRELVVCKMSSAYGIQLHNKHDSASATVGQQQVFLPEHFQSRELPPTQLLAQIKGKHVSHGILAKVSTQLGLSRILLEANRDVRNSLFGWVERNEINKARSSAFEKSSGSSTTLSPSIDNSLPAATDSAPSPSNKKPMSKREQASLRRKVQAAVLNDTPQATKQLASAISKGGPVDVPASLAEDAFEALLAALFLDSPAEAAAKNASSAGAAAQLEIPDKPMLFHKQEQQQQSYGISAARDFIVKTLGTPIIKDCYQAIDVYERRPAAGAESPTRRPFYLSANGGMPSYSISKAEEQGYDVRVNYKSLLEEYVRATHTDPITGVCQAHILYLLLGQFGAHAFRVRVIIKNISNFIPSPSSASATPVLNNSNSQHSNNNNENAGMYSKSAVILPYVRYMHNQELMRRGLPLENGKSSPYRFASYFQPSSPISFSLPVSHLPYIDPKADREFPTAVEQPEPQSAEQVAAFFALRQLRRV